MKNIDIIVMGKTGAGKSTLINAVLKEDLAPTGVGQAVTKENKIYSKRMLLPVQANSSGQYSMVSCNLNMYDTVGLEINNTITQKTLDDIERHIRETKAQMNSDDIHMVWFCVNDRSSRIEPYELNLIQSLSYDYEIPFVIVLTQCFSNEESEMEAEIRSCAPEILRSRVLAKGYSRRGCVIKAYGITELLQKSLNEYRASKTDIVVNKLIEVDEKRNARIRRIEQEANSIVEQSASSAAKIGYIPGGCIPFVHGICIKMIGKLNQLAGLKVGDGFAKEIFNNVIVGLAITPFMAVPVMSSSVAASYVRAIGNNYVKAMLGVIHLSSDQELKNSETIRQRLKAELTKLKK